LSPHVLKRLCSEQLIWWPSRVIKNARFVDHEPAVKIGAKILAPNPLVYEWMSQFAVVHTGWILYYSTGCECVVACGDEL
jgi:hypothetical protein